MSNIKYSNNYTIAERIFDNVLTWAASKNPTLTKEQMVADIEKILNLLDDKRSKMY